MFSYNKCYTKIENLKQNIMNTNKNIDTNKSYHVYNEVNKSKDDLLRIANSIKKVANVIQSISELSEI